MVSFIYQGNSIVKVIKIHKSTVYTTLPAIVNILSKFLTWKKNVKPDLLFMGMFFEEFEKTEEYKASLLFIVPSRTQ